MLQFSTAVAVPGSIFAEQVPGSLPLTMLAGQLITGAVVSVTVNVVLAVALLPALSVAVSVTVWVPSPTKEPAAGSR